MSLNVLILFAEADRAVAESLRSLLETEDQLQASLAGDVEDFRPAAFAVALLSPDGAASPRLQELLERARRERMEVVPIRLDRTPLDGMSLRHLAGRILQLLRPTRGGFELAPEEIDPGKRVEAYHGPAKEEAPPDAWKVPRMEEEPTYAPPRPIREPAEAAPEAAPPIRDNVHFSAYAPPAVTPGTKFLLSIWAYLKADRKEVEERASKGGSYQEAGYKGPLKVARGTEVAVCLDLPGFRVESPCETIAWEGEIANCDFRVEAPAGLAAGRREATATLLVAGVPIGRLLFELEVGAGAAGKAELPSRVEWIRTMFASYSNKDRVEVLQFKRGAEAAGVDVFVDVLSLRVGEDWAKRLEQEVTARDLFCLFWSKDASESKWVEKEWRAAYAAKGVSYIHPVPLADPRAVPPPPELGDCKHFNDVSRIVIEYEKQWRQTGS